MLSNHMVDEETSKPIRELLEQVRCMRWRCVKCGFTVHYTRPMPEHVVDPCPKCHGAKFVPAP